MKVKVLSELKRDISGRCHSGLSGGITSCDRVMATFLSRTADQTNRHPLMRGETISLLKKVGVTNRIFSFVKRSLMPEKYWRLKRIDGLKRERTVGLTSSILIRWEKKAENYEAMLHLTCGIIVCKKSCWNRI